MFQDYKAARFFAKAVIELGDKKAPKFTRLVKELFDQKSVSEIELPTYQITIKDIENILIGMNNPTKNGTGE